MEYLFPYDFEKAALREQLEQHGLTQVLHNRPDGDWAVGESGIAILPDRVDEFRDGVGEINYPFLFKHLDEIGYRGWIGCEYKPRTTIVEGLGWHTAQTVDA